MVVRITAPGLELKCVMKSLEVNANRISSPWCQMKMERNYNNKKRVDFRFGHNIV
jgi:L,D-peptidoglycan transpeptidase YkuD (ErfK/YbiS/YcfS/YnhG family)